MRELDHLLRRARSALAHRQAGTCFVYIGYAGNKDWTVGAHVPAWTPWRRLHSVEIIGCGSSPEDAYGAFVLAMNKVHAAHVQRMKRAAGKKRKENA